nr:MAG TPA: hypothetical protein [Microviridae sp.]
MCCFKSFFGVSLRNQTEEKAQYLLDRYWA